MKSNKEINDRLKLLLKNSGIKEKSEEAILVEKSFLLGMIFADEQYNTAYFQILLMSGRSILDDEE